jgi:DNA-binding transcriptional ArsR family regulator
MPNLDAAFSALADPTRRAILARAISRHLKVLEGAGLIVRRIEGTRRPCRMAPAAITEIDQWLGMLRDALAKNYDRLDSVLATMKPRKRKPSR